VFYSAPEPSTLMAEVDSVVTKDEILEAVRRLPDDATLDDALDVLFMLKSIERGEAQIAAGKGIPQDEVRRRMAQWRR
jgi:hypothetical protein